MSGPAQASGGPVRPVVALALACVAFVALLIFGLGMTSLLLDADIIASPGLGQLPAVAAFVIATAAFALTLWIALRRAHPSLWGSLWAALAAYLAYVGSLWVGVVIAGDDLALATDVAGRIATTWFGAVVAGAAAISAWSGIALVRTRAHRPRWPWEDEFDE